MRHSILSLALGGLAAFASHAQSPAPAATPAAPNTAASATAQAVAAQYAKLVQANYDDTLAGAKSPHASILAFTTKPSEEGL